MAGSQGAGQQLDLIFRLNFFYTHQKLLNSQYTPQTPIIVNIPIKNHFYCFYPLLFI